jgi:hypothetical protein
MTILDLMSFISITTPVGVSLSVGLNTHTGSGLLVGLIIGLISGIGSFFGMRRFSGWIARHPKLGQAQPGFFWTGAAWFLFVALFVWIIGFTFMGAWLTEFIVQKIAT